MLTINIQIWKNHLHQYTLVLNDSNHQPCSAFPFHINILYTLSLFPSPLPLLPLPSFPNPHVSTPSPSTTAIALTFPFSPQSPFLPSPPSSHHQHTLNSTTAITTTARCLPLSHQHSQHCSNHIHLEVTNVILITNLNFYFLCRC